MSRKLTPTELTRNGVYETIGATAFADFEVVGHVKQGLLLRNPDTGQDAVVKVIMKKDPVDFEAEQLERPTENIEDEDDDDEDVDGE